MQYLRRYGSLGIASLLACLLIGVGVIASSNAGARAVLSGIQGQVTEGPIRPLDIDGQPNSAPLAGVVVVVKQNGVEVARQTTDKNGDYKISVAPGAYQVVRQRVSGSFRFPRPPAAQTATVTASQYTTVNLSYDTGIR